MKNFFFIILFFALLSCTNNKGVYWCGDHPCINKKEKEAYFKKTMIVEVKNYEKNKMKGSEIDELLNQAKLNEKERILNEKKQKKLLKIEKKRRIKEEKELAKQVKLDEKKKIKEEKELEKQLELEKAKKIKKKESINKETSKLKKKEKTISIGSAAGNVEIPSEKFTDLVKKIIQRNSSRSYPEINDIPK